MQKKIKLGFIQDGPNPHGLLLHLMDPKHPRVRNATSFSKASSNGQDQAFFSKLASKAKMLSPSHPRVKIPHV